METKYDTFTSNDIETAEDEFGLWLEERKGSIEDMHTSRYVKDGMYHIDISYIDLGYKLKTKFN